MAESIKGMSALRGKMQKLKQNLNSGQSVERAGQSWVDENFIPAAQEFAPERTGALKDSISGQASGNKITLTVGVPYGKVVEEGDSDSEAQPYMAPALEQQKDALVRKIIDQLGKDMK